MKERKTSEFSTGKKTKNRLNMIIMETNNASPQV
ncbi:hypothetical protein T4B_4912 [Trichinella pseudospiralis]|uniref:Uncharacterized protein n=1 Tax=Trichinella pseudospiralis TaxID=6337 RepID=A0A0V1GA51_TRIPS|nr:hypothetical protein T4B_4912 [Trichinella pseudospiralis]